MNCKLCGAALAEKPGGHRKREFCSNAHKTAFFRRQHGLHQPKADTAQVSDLARDLDAAQERIRQLESQAHDLDAALARIRELEQQLDVEKRFLIDTHVYAFKAWLKKKHRAELPPIGIKMLEQDWFEPRGSRSIYEATLRRAGYSAEELQAFRNLWKLMLLEHPYQS